MYNIVIDLDNTICFPNLEHKDTQRRYAEALPNYAVINKLRYLKEKDYYIIVYTSRRMLTHNGDINKIKEDVGLITKDWLNKYNVPYDELIFGKPYSTTYYVDDKAMTVNQFINNDFKE